MIIAQSASLSAFRHMFLRYFPTPRFMLLEHAGVDISETAVRCLQLKRRGRQMMLETYGEYPLISPLDTKKSLKENTDLIEVLRKMRAQKKLGFVEVSIPESSAYLFTMEIPDGTDEEVRQHIEFHLEENVPLALPDAVFDYHRIRKDEATKTVLISVSVVPRTLLEDYIRVFTDAGMTPVSFLIENQAVTRSLISLGDQETYLIVYMREKKTVVSIVSEEAVQYTSSVSIGSDDFTQAIMKAFKVEKEEAERLKREKGFSRNKENEELFFALISTASALRDEINRMYMYWQSLLERNRKNDSIKENQAIQTTDGVTENNTENSAGKKSQAQTAIKRIILAGKDASIGGFRDYLALSIGAEVEMANVWTNVMSFDNQIPEILYNDSLDYATAVGLALPKDYDDRS